MRIARYGKTRYWAVYDAAGARVCVCLYTKGAARSYGVWQVGHTVPPGPPQSLGGCVCLGLGNTRSLMLCCIAVCLCLCLC